MHESYNTLTAAVGEEDEEDEEDEEENENGRFQSSFICQRYTVACLQGQFIACLFYI